MSCLSVHLFLFFFWNHRPLESTHGPDYRHHFLEILLSNLLFHGKLRESFWVDLVNLWDTIDKEAKLSPNTAPYSPNPVRLVLLLNCFGLFNFLFFNLRSVEMYIPTQPLEHEGIDDLFKFR